MASVKKTMKSSKTKQAKQPETPKAKASQHSTLLKAKTGRRRAGACFQEASSQQVLGQNEIKNGGSDPRHANSPVAAKPAARKKASAARAAPRE